MSDSNLDSVCGCPVQLKPLFDALDSTDVVLTETPLWEKYLVPIASNEYVKQAVGWKSLTEQINGRVAMIGYVTAETARLYFLFLFF